MSHIDTEIVCPHCGRGLRLCMLLTLNRMSHHSLTMNLSKGAVGILDVGDKQMKRLMVIIDRLKEPSTWAALAPAALVVGVAAPEFLVYAAGAVAVFVFFGVVLKEKGGTPK